jgi:heme-degrading monooxygenase HmoA
MVVQNRDQLTPFSALLGSSRSSEAYSSTTKELKMFTRHVTIKLKANSAAELTRTIEKEILPLLRKQKGFRDEITLVAPERSEAVALSFWDTQEGAEAYNRTGYPEVLKALSKVLEGSPKVQTFEVSNSTLHKIAAKAAASR